MFFWAVNGYGKPETSTVLPTKTNQAPPVHRGAKEAAAPQRERQEYRLKFYAESNIFDGAFSTR